MRIHQIDHLCQKWHQRLENLHIVLCKVLDLPDRGICCNNPQKSLIVNDGENDFGFNLDIVRIVYLRQILFLTGKVVEYAAAEREEAFCKYAVLSKHRNFIDALVITGTQQCCCLLLKYP